MNQIVGTKEDGKKFLVLVLEPGNIHKLTAKDEPIVVHVEDLFPDGIPRKLELAIFYSETPLADSKRFAQQTEVYLDERTPRTKDKSHCPECRSTLETMGMFKPDGGPVSIIFCPLCGCFLAAVPR